jgi:hypothetical protein
LVVDDFAVKYQKKEDVNHLLNTLKKDYEVTEDWTGTKYLGLTVVWDYENRKVHLWMPGYIKRCHYVSNMTSPRKYKTHRIHMPSQHTEPKYNMLKKKKTPPNLTKMTQNIFNK